MLTEPVFHGIPIIYIFAAVCIIMPRIPVIGKFFSCMNTAIHEFGHTVFALLFGGRVQSISINKDTSGVTSASNLPGGFAAFAVALAGYPTSASAAWLGLHLCALHAERAFLIGITVLFLVMLLFWIRNLFGVIWTTAFCALNIFLIYSENQYTNYMALFYAVSILTESAFSTLEQLWIVIKNPHTNCDSAVLGRLTHIPSILWALAFIAYEAFVCYKLFLVHFMM